MQQLFWVCLAGAAGSGARHLVTVWAAGRFGATLPAGTLIVNVVGCFAIAVLMQASGAFGWPPIVRTALGVGFLGGLTTYSSFNHDTLRLMSEGAPGAALLNVALTLGLGLAAGFAGLLVAREMISR